jgi:hypothetical protein
MVAGFAGSFQESDYGGKMGRWDTGKTPPLAHFVGGPDKIQNMKYLGFWNYQADALAVWTEVAAAKLRSTWNGAEDTAAAANPFEAKTAAALRKEGEAIRAAVRPLEYFSHRCGPKARDALCRLLSVVYLQSCSELSDG